MYVDLLAGPGATIGGVEDEIHQALAAHCNAHQAD
jgi:Tfp pilus assembly PilM family ATPase